MHESTKNDEIILGIGHGYLNYAESIMSGVKQMRSDINLATGRDFPRIHILDHDLDSEGNIVWLQQNEIIIRFKGKEKLRYQYDNIQSDVIAGNIVEKLKKIILDSISELSEVY